MNAKLSEQSSIASEATQKTKRRNFDHEILVLQGGGALGAYQAGVYEGLVEAGLTPTWIVGISIGGINAALIAGNPPERRVERLHEFWNRVSACAPLIPPPWLEPMQPAINALTAAAIATFGISCFFIPRVPPACFGLDGKDEALSVYDTTPLKSTLERLVDFDLINRRKVRLSLGTVNVRTGISVYFDNYETRIGPDHVRASGALPPGFPPVAIDGEHYWDGGVVSNSPLTYVWDQKPLTSALIVQVDVFNPTGKLPQNLDQVMERSKDIQYASKMRLNLRRIKELGELRDALRRVLAKLPPALKADADVRRLTAACDERDWTIVRLVNRRPSNSGQSKDYEFSRATVQRSWAAGLEDVRRSIAGRDWIKPFHAGAGLRFYDLPPEPSQRLHQTAARNETEASV